MANLLVVEDDIVTNEAICEYMKSAGHTTLSAFDGEQGLLMAKDPSVDLVVLDIMLPKMDGMTVLKELRKSRTVPTLMLTAIEDEHTQVTSFDAEADDYITKPFSMVLWENGSQPCSVAAEKALNCHRYSLEILL